MALAKMLWCAEQARFILVFSYLFLAPLHVHVHLRCVDARARARQCLCTCQRMNSCIKGMSSCRRTVEVYNLQTTCSFAPFLFCNSQLPRLSGSSTERDPGARARAGAAGHAVVRRGAHAAGAALLCGACARPRGQPALRGTAAWLARAPGRRGAPGGGRPAAGAHARQPLTLPYPYSLCRPLCLSARFCTPASQSKSVLLQALAGVPHGMHAELGAVRPAGAGALPALRPDARGQFPRRPRCAPAQPCQRLLCRTLAGAME